MSDPKKRRSLTIEEKRKIISNLESGSSNTLISQQYNLSHSTVSNIFKQRAEIKQMFDQAAYTTKKIRYSMHRDVENALIEWLRKHKNTTNVSINIQSLQAKADEIGKFLGKTNFKCSSSWVQRFKRRHYAEFTKTVGIISHLPEVPVPKAQIISSANINECTSPTTNIAVNWLQNVWPALRKGFSDEEIYTANETGLFYKLMPDQSFKFQGQRCTEGEFSNERLTILVTANITGTDKKKLLVIGKLRNPRSFKHIKDLPVQYEYNQKSWMTSSIFNRFLHKWDTELCQEYKKALVLIDDSDVHSEVDQFQSIQVVYLPRNNPPLIQPKNQENINLLKLQYKKKLILDHVEKIERKENAKINLFQAICMLESAWEQILPLSTCIGDAEFKEAKKSITEESLSSWASNLLIYDAKTLQVFENVDNELATSDQISDTECFNHRGDNEKEINTLETNEDEDEEVEKVTLNQAFEALNKLKQFLTTNDHFSKSYHHTKQLQTLLEKSLYKQKKSQTKITSYFKKKF